MKSPFRSITALLIAVILACPGCDKSHAQTPAAAPGGAEIKVAAGSSSGTYQVFLDQLRTVAEGITFTEYPEAHGAVENLQALLDNKVSMAFMHSDVLTHRALSTNLDQYKILLALFKEEVHFVALATSKKTVGGGGGFMGIGGKQAQVVVFNTIEDLVGFKVGASGGSYITAQLIKAQALIGYEVIQYNKGDEVQAALNKGEIDAAVFVGGAPIPNVEKLDRNYKLLSVPDKFLNPLKGIYDKAAITYPKISPVAVQTLAADAILVTKDYKTAKMRNLVLNFRKVFLERLPELQETPGLHTKWAEVSADNHGHDPKKWLE